MPEIQVRVELVWVDENGAQVGAKLSFGEKHGRSVDITLQEIQQNYRDKLTNAFVTDKGLVSNTGIDLPEQKLIRKTGEPVATYTLMHADTIICRVYPGEDRIETVAGEYLPFALTGGYVRLMDSEGNYLLDADGYRLTAEDSLSVSRFEQWLTSRTDNLSRTYMNRVYIARKVGRDREKILRDSCAISVIDNYWVRRSDVDTTWDELKSNRDTNLEVVDIALTGEIKTPPDFSKVEDDTISLFTIKGAFPKALYKGTLLKKDNNAEYEAAAYQLGTAIGISVAVAEKQNGVVECQLFTSEKVSMAHARDFLHYTDYEAGRGNDEHRALYDYFSQQGRFDIVAQLERLYIFNYLVENIDFHFENFGFLYDSGSFEINSVAPAYDFNNAFAGFGDTATYYNWILGKLPDFIRNHTDVKNQLQSTEFLSILKSLSDLTQEQKDSIRLRAEYLCRL